MYRHEVINNVMAYGNDFNIVVDTEFDSADYVRIALTCKKTGASIAVVWRLRYGLGVYNNLPYNLTSYNLECKIKELAYQGQAIKTKWNKKNFESMLECTINQVLEYNKFMAELTEKDTATINWFKSLNPNSRGSYQDREFLTLEHDLFRFELRVSEKNNLISDCAIHFDNCKVHCTPHNFKQKVENILSKWKA